MVNSYPEIDPRQSILLLKELHILTADGKMNQDSRRKLKQVYHLYQFIDPLLNEIISKQDSLTLVDHGSGKSYLGFILYDLFFKSLTKHYHLYSIDTRLDLINKADSLAKKLSFKHMSFLNLTIYEAITTTAIPAKIDVVTALHACDTATDDAIQFALNKQAKLIVLVPCCQAQIAKLLKQNKATNLQNDAIWQLWKRPIHTREFGSHVTNVLRILQLESHGYEVTTTELVGWEHSMKNELIIAKYTGRSGARAMEQLRQLLAILGLNQLISNFT